MLNFIIKITISNRTSAHVKRSLRIQPMGTHRVIEFFTALQLHSRNSCRNLLSYCMLLLCCNGGLNNKNEQDRAGGNKSVCRWTGDFILIQQDALKYAYIQLQLSTAVWNILLFWHVQTFSHWDVPIYQLFLLWKHIDTYICRYKHLPHYK